MKSCVLDDLRRKIFFSERVPVMQERVKGKCARIATSDGCVEC